MGGEPPAPAGSRPFGVFSISTMTALTDYEREQLARIEAWRAEAPALISRAFGAATSRTVTGVQRALPTGALKAALSRLQRAGVRTAARQALLRRAGLARLEALHAADLETCDRLARHVRRRGAALAGGSGALFGIAGVVGLAADVPTLLLQTFRIIHRIGLCYGEDCDEPALRPLPVAVFALASANSIAEKQAALDAIERLTELDAAAWRDGLERAAERELAKEAAVFSLSNLAKAAGRRLGLRKAAGGVPVFGALVGGVVNAWYLNDVVTAAQHVFQARWLARRHGPAVLASARA